MNFDAAPNGGASIGMLRIHQALLDAGVDSRIVCVKCPDAKGAVEYPWHGLHKVAYYGAKVLMKFLFGNVYSTGLIRTGRARAINALSPDAVVLHWLQGDTLSFHELEEINAPMFWMHHDMWPSLGLKSYPGLQTNGRCRRLADRLDRYVRCKKSEIYKKLGAKVTPAATNEWVATQIGELGMFGKRHVVTIPYPLSDAFISAHARIDESKRKRNRKFVILNGSNFGFCGGVKGADRLVDAIGLIPVGERKDMEIQIFGGGSGPENIYDVPVRYLGRFDENGLVPIYHQADVFAFPSRQETFGQTKIEAMACGTPVVAFNQTACAVGIRHKVNGWVADKDDVQGFSDGIRWFYKHWKNGRPVRVGGVASEYMPLRIAKLWIEEFERSVKHE